MEGNSVRGQSTFEVTQRTIKALEGGKFSKVLKKRQLAKDSNWRGSQVKTGR